MKTKLLIAIIFVLIACEKPKSETPVNGMVTFWTTEDSGPTLPNGDTGWILWVDDLRIGSIIKGDIPYCGQSGFTNMSLPAGRHKYKITRTIPPPKPPPNNYVGNTYYFDVEVDGCILVRATQ